MLRIYPVLPYRDVYLQPPCCCAGLEELINGSYAHWRCIVAIAILRPHALLLRSGAQLNRTVERGGDATQDHESRSLVLDSVIANCDFPWTCMSFVCQFHGGTSFTPQVWQCSKVPDGFRGFYGFLRAES